MRHRVAGTQKVIIAADARQIPAVVEDASEEGIGIACAVPLAEGALVSVTGAPGAQPAHRPALVSWCVALPDGSYRAGLSLGAARAHRGAPAGADAPPDYYELLQLSPKAHPDTIHRVFRILAQRYHPDNRETGDEEHFKELLRAYQVLSDPDRRAAYDVRRTSNDGSRWKIFERFDVTLGVPAEQRKRRGLLAVLYARRVRQPDQPFLTLRELEDLLSCPREHLEFSLWYLKEMELVARSDNGRYSITAKGVDEAESGGAAPPAERPQITSGE